MITLLFHREIKKMLAEPLISRAETDTHTRSTSGETLSSGLATNLSYSATYTSQKLAIYI